MKQFNSTYNSISVEANIIIPQKTE